MLLPGNDDAEAVGLVGMLVITVSESAELVPGDEGTGAVKVNTTLVIVAIGGAESVGLADGDAVGAVSVITMLVTVAIGGSGLVSLAADEKIGVVGPIGTLLVTVAESAELVAPIGGWLDGSGQRVGFHGVEGPSSLDVVTEEIQPELVLLGGKIHIVPPIQVVETWYGSPAVELELAPIGSTSTEDKAGLMYGRMVELPGDPVPNEDDRPPVGLTTGTLLLLIG